MSISLRDYQTECLKAILSASKAGISKQLVVMPTGSGKTVVMAAIAKEMNCKTLLIAHRGELLQQALDKFRLLWPEVDIGLCQAESDEIDRQVVIASVQTASQPKRLARLQQQGFKLLFVDEAHHATAPSYRAVIDGLGFTQGKDRLLCGVSATPSRRGLDEVFEEITFSRSVSTMISAGYLAPVVARRILTNFLFERIASRNGDFVLEDLAEAVDTVERNSFVAEKFAEHAKGRKAISFCCNVEHCRNLADAFKAIGIESKPVWGAMPQDERESTLEAFRRGHIQMLTSCGILVEGFDMPSVSAVVMARPTKSATLYIQSVGRGLRIWPGKENCLVLDFTDQGHNLDSVMTLQSAIPGIAPSMEGLEPPEEIVDRTPKIEIGDDVDQVFDILGITRFLWTAIDGAEWSLLDDERREIVLSPCGESYTATLYCQDGSSRPILSNPLPLSYAQGCAEDYARKYLKVKLADANASWMTGESPATEKQQAFLSKHNVVCENLTKAEAAIHIRQVIATQNKQRRNTSSEPATDKQSYFLKKHGIDTADMTKLQAQQAIARIKAPAGKARVSRVAGVVG